MCSGLTHRYQIFVTLRHDGTDDGVRPIVYLVRAVGHGEGELVGVLLFFTGVDVLDAARRQVSLGERGDSGPWTERVQNVTENKLYEYFFGQLFSTTFFIRLHSSSFDFSDLFVC